MGSRMRQTLGEPGINYPVTQRLAPEERNHCDDTRFINEEISPILSSFGT